jgi:exopolysaccharide production protein ExoZ
LDVLQFGMAESRTFFPGVHALRALAASLVVLEHAGSTAKEYAVMGYSFIIPHFSYGRIGVVLFFAISGFVIALNRARPIGEFIAHRLLRIYPGYWLAMLLAAVVLTAAGQPHISASPASVLLYPATVSDDSLWIPYWTLAFELTFYTLAAIAFAFRLSDRTLTIIAAVWIVAVNLFAPPTSAQAYALPGLADILRSPAVQVFPMGLICAIHFERFRRVPRWVYLAAAALAFAASIPTAAFSTQYLLTNGLMSSCLILAVADLDIRSHIVKRLGDASYGIYLVHFPAMIAASLLFPQIGAAGFFITGMITGTAFGLFDHALYRRMVAALSKRAPDLKSRIRFPASGN